MADQSVIDAITQAARARGVDPSLALAIAQVESGLNPTAVGDSGSSFGLFQLHRGGELGSLTQAQTFDPYTNASVALNQVGAVLRANPGITDPGVIAAMAQRPANQAAYAQAVDKVLGGSASSPTAQLAVNLNPLDLPGAVGSGIAGAFGGLFSGIAQFFAAAISNVGTFAKRNLVALGVAAVVILVLFR